MRRSLAVLVLVIGLIPIPARAHQVDIQVQDPGSFDPPNVGNRVGHTVRWSNGGSTTFPHNVREDGQLFRSGGPTTGAIDFSVVFSAGTFHYYCEVHGNAAGGMAGLVRIPVSINRMPDGLPFTVRWATEASETGSVYDVQFKVGSGDWRNWRTNTSTLSGVFGRNGNPVRVRDGVLYRFRARSQEGTEFSRYSPVRSFRP
jgi:plastocyanin